MRLRGLCLVLVACATARCDNAGAGRVLAIGTSGVVKGVVYLDRNGDRVRDAADTALRQVTVRLIAVGTQDTVTSAVSDSLGAFRWGSVPIGTYRVAVDTLTIGDSVRLVLLSPAQVAVTRGDSVTVTATVSFPLLSVRAARLLPAGSKVFVQGVILSHRSQFGDTTAHLGDTSRAIRLTRPRPNVFATIGDSVRLLGVTASRDGQATLDDAAVFQLGASGGATPVVTTAAVAQIAQGGALDAQLVFVSGVVIVDTATVPGTGSPPLPDRLVTVDDSPADTLGRLQVLVDGNAGFGESVLASLRPDAVVSVTGVLVPTTGGRWRLKPRLVGDIVVQ